MQQNAYKKESELQKSLNAINEDLQNIPISFQLGDNKFSLKQFVKK